GPLRGPVTVPQPRPLVRPRTPEGAAHAAPTRGASRWAGPWRRTPARRAARGRRPRGQGRCRPGPRITPEGEGRPVRGTRAGVRATRGKASPRRVVDSNRPSPHVTGPPGKLPPPEGTGDGRHPRTGSPWVHQSLRDEEPVMNFRTT